MMQEEKSAILRVQAPAKINFFLKVIRKREDDFHEIETRMHPLSLYDSISIEASDKEGMEFRCSDPALPMDENNLVVRAAKCFEEKVGVQINVQISLEKNIPLGAGLGGGSSDAAAVLRGLNHYVGVGLSLADLVTLGKELGSDVPFFLYQGVCLCRGRGEHVEPLSFAEELPILLIKPCFDITTAWAYERWEDSLPRAGVPYTAQATPWGEALNDLERPVYEKYIYLSVVKNWLLRQEEVDMALLSGSGSTVFAILNTKNVGETLQKKLEKYFGKRLWIYLGNTLASADLENCPAKI